MAELPTLPPLVLPYPPSANVYYRHANGRMLLSREGREYKTRVAVALILTEPRPVPGRGPIGVRLDLYRPRKAGDADNRIKPILDALNGHAWDDDKQVAELHVYRYDDRSNPRVEVRVWPLPAAPEGPPR